MAASGSQTIQLYYSTSSGTAPVAGNLASGELALNITDGKLYYKDNGGVVQVLATKAATSGSFSDITISGSETISSGTANGVAYLNGSKVLTTGSALTFDGTTLQTAAARGTYSLKIYNSSDGSVAGNFGALTGNVFAIDATGTANIMTFLTGGSEQMRLTSKALMVGYTSDAGFSGQYNAAFSGNVGIGTSSPAKKLDVAGTYRAQIDPSSGSLFGSTLTLAGDNGTNQSGARVAASYEGGFGLSFQISTAGQAGLSSDPSLLTYSTRMRLDSSGNVGLGVTPSAWSVGKVISLSNGGSVFGGSGTTDIRLIANAYFNGGWKYQGSGTATRYDQDSGSHAWYTAPSGTAGDAISFTQAMTLDASANLFVASTERPTITGGGGMAMYYNGGSSQIFIGHSGVGVSGDYYSAFVYSGTVIGSITQNGTTGVLYNITSDQRLKENIVDAPEFGGVIDSIKVRSYDWKADGNHQRAGFIAQELVTVAPEAVHQPEDPEEMMAVDYSKLVPMLVKELQSLRARVAQLEAK